MSTFTRAILVTDAIVDDQGDLQMQFRIGLPHNYYGEEKHWNPDSGPGSWNLAGTFDASKVYATLGEAYEALHTLSIDRLIEMKGCVKYTKGIQLIYQVSATFNVIKATAISWSAEMRAQNAALEDDLQTV